MTMKVLFFTSPSCGFCPFIEDILKRIVAGVDHLELKVVDISKDIAAAEEYDIVAIPTIVLPNNGGPSTHSK